MGNETHGFTAWWIINNDMVRPIASFRGAMPVHEQFPAPGGVLR